MEKEIEQQRHRESRFFNVKIAAVLLLSSNLLYLLFMLIIAHNNVPQADDYCFIVTYRCHGFFGSLKWWYLNWQGRFMPYICINLFLYIYDKFGTLLPYTLFIVFIYIFSLYHLLFKIFSPKAVIWEKLLIAGLSLTVFNSLLLFHLDTSTFFWINVSSMYFGGVGFFLLGVNQVFAKTQTVFSYFVLFLSFLYAGSSSEHFGLMSLLLSAGGLVSLLLIKKGSITEARKKSLTRKMGIATAAGAVAFLIMYLSPGNDVRRAIFPHSSVVNAIRQTPSAINYLLFLLLPSRMVYLFMVLLSFIFAGAYFGYRGNKESLSNKLSIVFCLVLLGAIFFTQLLFVYALSHSGPTRAYVHLSMLFVMVVGGFGFLIGINQVNKIIDFHYLLVYISAVLILLVSASQIKSSLYPTMQYAKSVKARMSLLKQVAHSNYKGTLQVDSLKFSDKNILLNSDLAKTASDSGSIFINNCLEGMLNLKFKIYLKR
ncbi:MAG: DUF6056 family protein [Ferruginibacter sp.]